MTVTPEQYPQDEFAVELDDELEPEDGAVEDGDYEDDEPDAGELDLEDRHALRRVAGLSTELEDVSEVE